MTDHTTVDEENAPTVTEEPAQEEIITQQANQPQTDTEENVVIEKPGEEQPREDAKVESEELDG